MRRSAFIAVLGAAMAGAAAGILLSFLFLPGIFVFGGWAATAGAILAALFIPRFGTTDVRASPEEVEARLAFELRAAQYRVEGKAAELRVRVGRFSAVRIRFRPTSEGTRASFYADATPSGWGFVMFTLLAFGLGLELIAIPLVLYVFATAVRFVDRRVGPLVPGTGALAPPPADEVRAALVDGLSEAHRLAAEAFEAERSRYQDSQALVFLGGVLAWALSLATFTLVPLLPGSMFSSLGLVWVPAVPAIAVSLPFAILVYLRFEPRIRRFREWAERLRAALAAETSRTLRAGSASSAFELLAEAGAEVLEWIEARRKSGLYRYPAAGYLLVVMAVYTFLLFEAAVFEAAGLGFAWAALLGAGGVALGALTAWFYRRWERERAGVAREELEAWKGRFAGIRAQMERFVEGL